ncbi:MAG: conjugal transfer protein [Actinobacteria bacterium]|nr:conjugal transfer protein [Actinomycetota bacterium]
MTQRPAGLLRLAVVAGLIVIGLATGDRGGTPPGEPAAPAGDRQPVGATDDGTPGRVLPAVGRSGAPTRVPTATSVELEPTPPGADPAEFEVARTVAGAFAAGYATHRYDDPPDGLVGRLAPYASPELLDRLRQASGALAARQDIATFQQVATAEVEAVISEHASPQRVVVLVAVRQTVTDAGGQRLHRPVYRLTVEPGPEGWRVTAMDR